MINVTNPIEVFNDRHRSSLRGGMRRLETFHLSWNYDVDVLGHADHRIYRSAIGGGNNLYGFSWQANIGSPS